jgi:hypothetical protein
LVVEKYQFERKSSHWTICAFILKGREEVKAVEELRGQSWKTDEKIGKRRGHAEVKGAAWGSKAWSTVQ